MLDKKILRPTGGTKENGIASMLHIFSVLSILGGIFAGIMMAQQERVVSGYYSSSVESFFSFSTLFSFIGIGIFLFVILNGIAEIICLLQLKQSQSYELVKADEQVESEKVLTTSAT